MHSEGSHRSELAGMKCLGPKRMVKKRSAKDGLESIDQQANGVVRTGWIEGDCKGADRCAEQ